MTLSGSIAKYAERFTVEALVAAAEELLRQHSNAALDGAIDPARVEFYIEREWVDEPIRDEEGEHFRRRHLLQLCAVQVLRGLDMNLDDIGKLLRGVDNEHLKMLCDDPVEAEKKAAVMSNWLSMLDQGRRPPSNNGKTLPSVKSTAERAFAAPPAPAAPPPPPPAAIPAEGPPDDLPDAPANGKPASAQRGRVRAHSLPLSDRNRNTLLSVGDEAMLAALDSRTPLQPPGMVGVPAVVTAAPVAKVAPAPVAAEGSRPMAWMHHPIVAGVELHVRVGRNVGKSAELEQALARIREILAGRD